MCNAHINLSVGGPIIPLPRLCQQNLAPPRAMCRPRAMPMHHLYACILRCCGICTSKPTRPALVSRCPAMYRANLSAPIHAPRACTASRRIQAGRDCLPCSRFVIQGRAVCLQAAEAFGPIKVCLSSNATRTIVPAVQPLRRRPSVRGHGGPSIERRPAWHRIRSVALPRPSPSAADALRVSAAAAAAAEAVAYADNVVLNVPTPSWYLENATEEPNVVVVC